MIIYSFICFNQSGLDLKKYIPGGVLDPAQYHHELQAPEARYKLARAVLQEIPRQVIVGLSVILPELFPELKDSILFKID